MKTLVFQVKFLSDIVLPATSNTEGNIKQLDFIPGSNFLGMVAVEYESFSDSFSMFHSGAVRFGDASIVVDDKLGYKMPLSFFYEKLAPSEIVNHHLVKDFSVFTQLKQKRNGYISKDLESIELKYNYAQKSAYDKEHRRSKEGYMYGYMSIPSGTHWQFVVKYDDSIKEADVEKLKESLLGRRRLGKSKSAQYGRVDITMAHHCKEVGTANASDGLTYVYAKSRLALVDKEGMPTYDLVHLVSDLKSEQVVLEKMQIKTSSFTPYNGAMQTKCYERAVIDSGSVIVLKNLSDAQRNELEQGVGMHLSEGFGEVILNPAFLLQEGKFTLLASKGRSVSKTTEEKDPVTQFLANRENGKLEMILLAKEVNDFVSSHKNLYEDISNAQWGNIRSICNSPSHTFRDEIRSYIDSGKVTWTSEQIETLLEEGKSLKFIQMLSMHMPKTKKEK